MALKIEIGGHGRTLPPTSSPLDWDDWYQGFWDGSKGVDLNSYLVTFFVLELQHPQKLGLGMFRNGFLWSTVPSDDLKRDFPQLCEITRASQSQSQSQRESKWVFTLGGSFLGVLVSEMGLHPLAIASHLYLDDGLAPFSTG